MLEQDSDAYQWGQRLFDTYPFFNSAYPSDSLHRDSSSSICYVYYPMNHYVTEHSTIENDAVIAHTLQEDYSDISLTHQHGWHSQSVRPYYTGDNYDYGESNDTWSSSLPSTYGDEGYTYSQKTNDEYECGEFTNPLDQLVPIPHVPRINGEMPSTDEVSSDYERLRQRLQLYDLDEREVRGDGNCQFRSLSDQLYHTPDHHENVRQEIVNQLRTSSKFYEGYVPMEYDECLSKMSRNGEWGDHVKLQAAADVYGARILVITSFKDTCYIEILPNNQKTKRVLLLSFWAEVHYNSIYPRGDIPSSNSGKKKRWWPF